MYMDEEGTTLASEILHELKASAKRWFILAMVELVIILAMAAGIVYYLTLPVDYETVTVENEKGNANYIGNDLNGRLINGEDNGDER